MITLLAFAITLLVAGLLSGRAKRTALSTNVLFLVAGFLLGNGGLRLIALRPDYPLLRTVAELALFSVLFSDGMRSPLREFRPIWHLPGRALLLGLPLILTGTALVAHVVAGLSWLDALLMGAVLSPTDPVFAEAIVTRKDVPRRLRGLLNIESGMNDGLALPFVLLFLAYLQSTEPDLLKLLAEVVSGILLGVALPWIVLQVEALPIFTLVDVFRVLNAVAIGLILLALSKLLHANEFLAAFTSGIAIRTIAPAVADSFGSFGEIITELLKFAALLLFGALLSLTFLSEIGARGYIFAILAIALVRPMALWIAFLGSRLPFREWAAAAWFGPKGYSSVVYAIMVLQTGVDRAEHLFHLAAIVIVGSIVVDSSTDVLVARWVRRTTRVPADMIDEGHQPGNQFTKTDHTA